MRFVALAALALAGSFSIARADATVPSAVAAPDGPRWEARYDFDGDGRPDRVEVRYSGGGHCCYYLRLHLTKTKRAVPLPFELDGGYPWGLDLSRPDHFDVRDTDGDGAADLLMEIATYGGRNEAIPEVWTRRGVHSHHVVLHFNRGRMRIENRREPPKQR